MGYAAGCAARARARLPSAGRGPRAVGARARRAGGGVPVDALDLRGVDTQAVGDDLGEARLVALAVRRGAGEGRHAAARVDAHDSALPAAALDADPVRADDARRRDA